MRYSNPAKSTQRTSHTDLLSIHEYKKLSYGPVSQLSISLRDTKRRVYHSSTSTRPYTYEMGDAGGPGSVRKCPGAALADPVDVEGFDRSGEEDQLYAFQLSDGVYKRKKFTPLRG